MHPTIPAHDSHSDTKVTLAGGNEIEIIEARMTVLGARLRAVDTRRHCGYVHLAGSSNGIEKGFTVSDDLFSTDLQQLGHKLDSRCRWVTTFRSDLRIHLGSHVALWVLSDTQGRSMT